AAVDEEEHRQWIVRGRGRRDHVDGEAVLAHRLVLVDADDRVPAPLWRAERELMAVPDAAPRNRRMRRAKSQPADRGARVRDGAPPRHAVVGETLDRAARGRDPGPAI